MDPNDAFRCLEWDEETGQKCHCIVLRSEINLNLEKCQDCDHKIKRHKNLAVIEANPYLKGGIYGIQDVSDVTPAAIVPTTPLSSAPFSKAITTKSSPFIETPRQTPSTPSRGLIARFVAAATPSPLRRDPGVRSYTPIEPPPTNPIFIDPDNTALLPAIILPPWTDAVFSVSRSKFLAKEVELFDWDRTTKTFTMPDYHAISSKRRSFVYDTGYKIWNQTLKAARIHKTNGGYWLNAAYDVAEQSYQIWHGYQGGKKPFAKLLRTSTKHLYREAPPFDFKTSHLVLSNDPAGHHVNWDRQVSKNAITLLLVSANGLSVWQAASFEAKATSQESIETVMEKGIIAVVNDVQDHLGHIFEDLYFIFENNGLKNEPLQVALKASKVLNINLFTFRCSKKLGRSTSGLSKQRGMLAIQYLLLTDRLSFNSDMDPESDIGLANKSLRGSLLETEAQSPTAPHTADLAMSLIISLEVLTKFTPEDVDQERYWKHGDVLEELEEAGVDDETGSVSSEGSQIGQERKRRSESSDGSERRKSPRLASRQTSRIPTPARGRSPSRSVT